MRALEARVQQQQAQAQAVRAAKLAVERAERAARVPKGHVLGHGVREPEASGLCDFVGV